MEKETKNLKNEDFELLRSGMSETMRIFLTMMS